MNEINIVNIDFIEPLFFSYGLPRALAKEEEERFMESIRREIPDFQYPYLGLLEGQELRIVDAFTGHIGEVRKGRVYGIKEREGIKLTDFVESLFEGLDLDHGSICTRNIVEFSPKVIYPLLRRNLRKKYILNRYKI